MPPRLLVPLLAIAATLPALAQTATDLNEGVQLTPDPAIPDNFELSFWARSGYTYFIQHSPDLTAWSYFPVVEPGQDAVIRYGFTSSAPRVFVRLRYVDETLADPLGTDSDGDGLTNQQEFTHETDPFDRDTDHDGLPDAWEIAHALDPRNPADALADPNGNSVSNLDEYREGTDPRRDFYQGVAPTLTVIDGADQIRRPGEFLPRPLRVRVTRAGGTAWAGAPVRFTASADEGLLSIDTTEAHGLHPALTVNADPEGYAQVWLKCP